MKIINKLVLILTCVVVVSCTVQKKTQNAENNTIQSNTWVLLDNFKILKNYEGQDLSLSIDPSTHTLTGFAGCNNFTSTQYSVNNDGYFDIGTLNVGDKNCPDSSVEKNFLDLLKNANIYKVENNQLYLYKDALLLLTFDNSVE